MKEIAKGVFHLALMPRNAINCYVIDDILVDAGIRSSAGKILKSIAGRSIKKHVLTHAHADHQGSSSRICEKLKIPLLTSELEKTGAESGLVTDTYPDKNHFIARFQQRYWAGSAWPVSETIKEGDMVGSFTVVETPGHAAGHLSFFREEDGVLIAGDVMLNMNLLTTSVGLRLPPHLFTTNMEQNIHSVKKLAALKPKVICFGHGPVLFNNGAFEKFVEKLS
ncbi:MBL fold metallo-hydrolase [Pedobacter nyackensis]|uniref:Glyoxylase, beta-lactamase superfamily II n=1 Tax=Pedobacter nyackensis TaxID=475255 RepID=A0A1W2DSH4_9SPHI|nr:MBL fold metallo-hydrolase [Pedobacter nyackensis]SMD00411.1 Glyoxylase, beta-lactamase superfamily II [Pedobacter nyackensis]